MQADDREHEQRLQITLPEGWTLASPPKGFEADGPARTALAIRQEGRTLTVTRQQRLARGVHPVGDYERIRKRIRSAVRQTAASRDLVLTFTR